MKTAQQLPLVNRRQAEFLRKAGFDWSVSYFFIEVDEIKERTFAFWERTQSYGSRPTNYNHKDWKGLISAPTVALALKFVIEKIKKKHDNNVPRSITRLYLIDMFSTTESLLSKYLDELITVISPQIEKEK